jgi:uncharacterized protein YbaR (Trm112 family)
MTRMQRISADQTKIRSAQIRRIRVIRVLFLTISPIERNLHHPRFRGAFVIGKELLDILRCPFDPAREARLEVEADALVCQRCRLKFPIKEGLPCMLVEEAELPPGVSSLQALPCQQTAVTQEVQG